MDRTTPVAPTRGVVVGYDHRHRSARFARETAAVLAAARGSRVGSRRAPWPTPVTAYAVRAPRRGRGRDGDGEPQPRARQRLQGLRRTPARRSSRRSTPQIAAGIEAAGAANAIAYDADSPLIEPARRRRDRRVSRRRGGRACRPTVPAPHLRVVYTPMHGVGLDVFRALLERAGFDAPMVVEQQAKPDPDVPDCAVPEPGGAGRPRPRARPRAASPRRPRARATIPTPTASRWRSPTAAIGGSSPATRSARCSARTCSRRAPATTASSPAPIVVVATARPHRRAAAGVPARATLTGFKWISRAGDADGRRLVFGYEEALGYAVTPRVRDKDGLTAGARDRRSRGTRLADDALDTLAAAHGLHATAQWSMRFADSAARPRSPRASARHRRRPSAASR